MVMAATYAFKEAVILATSNGTHGHAVTLKKIGIAQKPVILNYEKDNPI